MSEKKEKRLLELDALRGIAALFVVLFHFTLGRGVAEYGFKLGVTGVDLFFMISGFVIFLTLKKTKDWKDFAVSRFSRLYPTYWCCVSFTTLILVSTFLFQHRDFGALLPQYLANMTMFQRPLGQKDIDGPYWTMFVEMLFYFYMLGVFVCGKLAKIESLGMATLVAVLLCAAPAFRTHFPNAYAAIHHWIPLVNHFPLFLAGITFYLLKFDKITVKRWFLVTGCFSVQLLIFKAGVINDYLGFSEYAAMVGVYFLLFVLYVLESIGFLVNQVTLFLGGISFGLYLIHQHIALKVLLPLQMKFLHFSFWLSSLTALAIVLWLAWMITICIEKPAMRFIRKSYQNSKRGER